MTERYLPHGWQLIKLRDAVTKVGSGVTPKGGKETYLASGVPLIRSQNVLDGVLDISEVAFISEEQHKQMSGSAVKPGDVLLNITGASIGRSCVVPDDIGEANVNQHVCVIRPTSAITSSYLNLVLCSEYGQRLIDSYQAGGGRQGLNFEQIKAFPIPTPPSAEQLRITTAINTWDIAITLQARRLYQLRKRKKEIAFRLLSKLEHLPGFNQSWESLPLSAYFNRLTTRNAVGNTNVLTISAQQGLVSQTRYFNKSIASDEVSNYYLLNRGDFAYNKSYSAGYPMGVIKPLIHYEQGIVSPLYICLRPTTDDGEFFKHYFEAGMMNRGISQIAQEGARNHGLLNVSAKDFMELDTTVPPPAERRAIAEVLNTADSEICLEEQKLAALREQKRGLLHQLLTGQLRLS